MSDDERLTERIAKVEGILEQMNERLNHLGDNVETQSTRMDSLFKQMSTLSFRLVAVFSVGFAAVAIILPILLAYCQSIWN